MLRSRVRPLPARLTALVALGALAVVPAACGGDDDDGEVTKEQFIENADAICKETNEDIQQSLSDLSDDATNEEAADVALERAVPRFREQIEQLRDLDPPAADAEEIEALWDDLDASTDELEAKLRDDPDGAFTTEFDPFSDESEFAAEFGFTECGG
jgi:hypothetical protein